MYENIRKMSRICSCQPIRAEWITYRKVWPSDSMSDARWWKDIRACVWGGGRRSSQHRNNKSETALWIIFVGFNMKWLMQTEKKQTHKRIQCSRIMWCSGFFSASWVNLQYGSGTKTHTHTHTLVFLWRAAEVDKKLPQQQSGGFSWIQRRADMESKSCWFDGSGETSRSDQTNKQEKNNQASQEGPCDWTQIPTATLAAMATLAPLTTDNITRHLKTHTPTHTQRLLSVSHISSYFQGEKHP